MIQHIFGTCTCYRITAKCRTMLTKSQHSGCLLIHQYCAHRKSATDTFCHSYYIWMYSKLLIAEKCTCTAHACLDLVYYKYQILLFTDVCDLFHKLRICRNYSAFSLLSKLVLTLCMIVGRLEVLPILVLFSKRAWSRS